MNELPWLIRAVWAFVVVAVVNSLHRGLREWLLMLADAVGLRAVDAVGNSVVGDAFIIITGCERCTAKRGGSDQGGGDGGC